MISEHNNLARPNWLRVDFDEGERRIDYGEKPSSQTEITKLKLSTHTIVERKARMTVIRLI